MAGVGHDRAGQQRRGLALGGGAGDELFAQTQKLKTACLTPKAEKWPQPLAVGPAGPFQPAPAAPVGPGFQPVGFQPPIAALPSVKGGKTMIRNP
jgi:hypothetical protein